MFYPAFFLFFPFSKFMYGRSRKKLTLRPQNPKTPKPQNPRKEREMEVEVCLWERRWKCVFVMEKMLPKLMIEKFL